MLNWVIGDWRYGVGSEVNQSTQKIHCICIELNLGIYVKLCLYVYM